MADKGHMPRRDEPAGAAPASGDASARILRLGLVVVLVGLLAWTAGAALLVIFAGILLGVLLNALAEALARHTSAGHQWAVGIVSAAALALMAAAALLVVPSVAAQVDLLWAELIEAVQQFNRYLQQWLWGATLVQANPLGQLGEDVGQILSKITGFAALTVNALGALVVIAFLGLYLAIDPQLYVRGTLALVPPGRRARAREVLNELMHTLRWWLIGRAFSMIVIGVMIGAGLWLLGVELALTLGLLSGVLNFVPYIGPIVAAVPGVLVGFAQGPTTGYWVLGLYVFAEMVESYVLTPVVLRRTVEMPPALTLAAELLGGVFFGVMGVAMATPLAAAALVLVRMLYVEDRLGIRSG